MGSRVTAFRYNEKAGALTEVQTISTLPDDFHGVNNSAELDIDSRGRFLYASNRGHDSIAIFSIQRTDGTLKPVNRVSSGGKTPRSIKLDPTGKYLLAANQDSDNVVEFHVDQKTGDLHPTGKVLEVGAPVCIQFVPAAL
jgi:6-phosphogluconolactonase